MSRLVILAALVLSCSASYARADESAIGSLRLPLPAADLAALIGIHRVDRATLPVDIVRLAFASPDNANAADAAVRARLTHALARSGARDSIPLPLSQRTWIEQILRTPVPDGGLAAAIFARRSSALLYHGLLAMEPATLSWLERNPAALRTMARYPGAVAVFAGSITIRDGVVDTPGDDARAVWTSVVGADPAQPSAFIDRLLAADDGAVAAFYHTIARLDAAHQAFAIGRRGDPRRVDRARELIAATRSPAVAWRADRPFVRPDIDLLLLLRAIAVDDRGAPRPPASHSLWSRVFGQGSGNDVPVDAAWIARQVLGSADGEGKRRLDVFRFAQRTFGAASGADLAAVLREHHRFPALIGVLETFVTHDPAAYAAAIRAAAAVESDDTATTLFQSGLALIDRAHRSRAIDDAEARSLSGSLAAAAVQRENRRTIATWLADALVPAFTRNAAGDKGDKERDAEHVVLEALAG